jgi:hypothetical protein
MSEKPLFDDIRFVPVPGAPAVWLRRDTGGYGYLVSIPVTVVRLGKVRVRVETEDGRKHWTALRNLFPPKGA